MEIPKEYELLRKRLVGDWSFRITRQMPDGFSLAGEGIMQVRELTGGYALETLYRSGFPGREPYEEYELWGYDKMTGTIRVYCANSRYAVLEFSGEWKDDTTMTLSSEEEEEGKRIRQHFTFTWQSPNEIHTHQVTTVDGAEGPISDLIMTRGSR